MSVNASEQVPPGDSCRPPSRVSDVNDAESHQQPKHNRKKAPGDSSQSVPPQDRVDNIVTVSSSEESTHGFSLASLLRTSAPHVSLVLENTGSVARDHLANERTWLAYVRTSLSIAGTGVAFVELLTISESIGQTAVISGTGASLHNFARPLGAATVLLGLFVLGIGVLRYFKTQTAMTRGQFPPARGTVVIITSILAALVAITFGILAATKPDRCITRMSFMMTYRFNISPSLPMAIEDWDLARIN